jgi:hypothetical protein
MSYAEKRREEAQSQLSSSLFEVHIIEEGSKKGV